MQVLIVNPQQQWVQRIQARLESSGAKTVGVVDWKGALEAPDQPWPDVLIIEDRILEKEISGLMALLREADDMPLILPTSFTHLGADVSQVSPRDEAELRHLEVIATRLKGVFEPAARQLIRVGKLTIDPARKEVVFAARRVPLPPIQFQLLIYLALNAGRVVEQRELVREIWGYATSESEAQKLIKDQVRLVRRKLGWTDDDSYLKSVRGFGYMLSAPPRPRIRKPNELAPGDDRLNEKLPGKDTSSGLLPEEADQS